MMLRFLLPFLLLFTATAEPQRRTVVVEAVAADPVMMPWVIPGGTHTFNRPLVIEDMSGVHWRGYGSSRVTRLEYVGPPTKAFITLSGCSRCRLSDFEIVISVPGVDAAVLVTNSAVVKQVSTNNVFDNVRVVHGGKPTAARRGFSVDSYAAGGTDGNNDHHHFIRCYALSHTEAGFYVRGSQCHDLIFTGCAAHDHGGRKPVGFHAADGVFVTLRDMAFNSNSVDILCGAAEVQLVVDGCNSENASQFIVYPAAHGMLTTNVANVQWRGKPTAGKPAVDVAGAGPWTFRNVYLSGLTGVCPTMRFVGGDGSADLSGIRLWQHGGTMPTGALVVVPVAWETRSHGLRYVQIPATGPRVSRRVVVNQAMTGVIP